MTLRLLKKKKVLIATGSVLGVLLIVQTTTYFLKAERLMPRAGIRGLADYALLRGRDFAVVEPHTWAQSTDLQKQGLSEELLRNVRTVYHSVQDVPDSAIVWEPMTQKERENLERYLRQKSSSADVSEMIRLEVDSGRRIVGFKNGIQIGWKLEVSGLFWMKCESSHWVSETGAEGRSDVFIWILGRWLRVYNVYRRMS